MSEQAWDANRLYAIADREWTEEDGVLVATHAKYLVKFDLLLGNVGLMLFTSRELADRFLAAKPDPVFCTVTFRDFSDLLSRIEELPPLKCHWILFDHQPKGRKGRALPIEAAISYIRRRMEIVD